MQYRENCFPCLPTIVAVFQQYRVLRIVSITNSIDIVTVHTIDRKLASTAARYSTSTDILPVITNVSAAQYSDSIRVTLGRSIWRFSKGAGIYNGRIAASSDQGGERITFKHFFPLRYGWCR